MTDRATITTAVFILLICLSFQVIFSMRQKAPTADELAHHVANGHSYLSTGNFKMNPASPPLPRMLSALPLFFLGAKAPLDHPSWIEGNSPSFAHQFFYVYNHRADEFIFWARIPTVILSLLFGFFIFKWSRLLFGNMAALTSLSLYVFCPDILAHSGLATADLAIAFFFFLTIMSFWFYLKEPSYNRLLVTAALVGLSFLSKYSAILLFPILLFIALFSKKSKLISLPKTTLFLIICFLTLWGGYFFEFKPLLKDTPDPAKKIAFIEKMGGPTLTRLSQTLPIPLATFFSGIASMAFTRSKGINAYLMGEWSREGWWYYYIIAFLIKNTIPFIILSLLSLILLRQLKLDRLTRITLTTPIIFFFIITLGDKAQAGIRYFLPIYPFFIILSGGLIAWFWKHLRRVYIFKTAIVLLLFWHALEALLIFPHHLSYFNECIGGPKNGYKWLRDSNLDWGQDLKGLAKFVKEKRYPEIALLYPWPADPHYYKIPYHPLPHEEFTIPQKKVYAISAHVIDAIPWTSRHSPVEVIGHSIFVYDLTKRENQNPPCTDGHKS